MKARFVVPVLLLAVLFVLVGCTRFTFKQGQRGSAPLELRDEGRMARIEAGEFEMGSPNAEPDEYPPHRVRVAAFLIDKTEVTIEDYEKCVRAGACRRPSLLEELDGVTPQHPIVGVNHADATRFCAWVGKRLPREAEWERAARSSRGGPFPWDGPYGPGRANLRGEEDGYVRTAPVGSFPAGASSAGALDLAGNASEWTADWYEATWYGKRNGTSPEGPSTPTGSRVVRGGSWSDNDHLARSAARLGVNPNLSNDAIGFRCAR